MKSVSRARAALHGINKGLCALRPRRFTRACVGSAAGLFLLAALPITSSAQVSFAEFPVPAPSTAPEGITRGPDGAVWFTENGPGSASGIGSVNANGVSTECSTSGDRAQQIVEGPDGNLYYTEVTGNYIGQVTPSCVVTHFPIPTAAAVPVAIAVGSDGAIWFTEAPDPGTSKIGRVTTTGAFTEYSTGLTAGSLPVGITPGPNGTLFFTEFLGNRIGMITSSGAITEFSATLTANANPFGIVYNPGDGNLWFAEQGVGQIGVMNTSGALLHEYALPSITSKPTSITVGPDGALWFTEEGDGKIGRISTGGTITEYAIPTSNSGPYGITVGADNAIWFTEGLAGAIGRISEISFESFQLVGGELTQVSIGADGTIFGINQGEQTYTYNLATSTWTNVPGSLTSISVGNATNVWGLNYAHQIYRYNSSNNSWTNVPGELNQISVGADGDVWGLNYQNNIYHYNASAQSWTQIGGQLTFISVGSAGAVYGMNDYGSIYWYNPGLGGFSWLTGTVGYSNIAVGVDGDLWAVKNNVAYHWDVLHNEFVSTGASIARVVVGAGAAVFGLSPPPSPGTPNEVFQWDATGQTFVP